MEIIEKLQEVNRTIQGFNALVQSLSVATDSVIEFTEKIKKISPITKENDRTEKVDNEEKETSSTTMC